MVHPEVWNKVVNFEVWLWCLWEILVPRGSSIDVWSVLDSVNSSEENTKDDSFIVKHFYKFVKIIILEAILNKLTDL